MSTFVARERFPWKLRGRSLVLGERTLIMAIVNITPDSFSGDGVAEPQRAIDAALAAVDSGADIVDLGAESTRPGSQPLSSEEELGRLLPVLRAVRRSRPEAVVSVDTYHARTARVAAEHGAEIVNDVSGLLWDPDMAAAVAECGCGLVLTHTRGRPQEWPTQPRLAPQEVVPCVREGLREQLAVAEAAGIARERIVVDPGFGFGKRGAENFALLSGLPELRELVLPVLAGVSRKGFLGQAVTGVQPEAEGLPVAEARRIATLAANVAAIFAGAHILRVHEVQGAREAAAVADAVRARK